MQFAKLRLTGFKSFVDPTELIIDSGMTGIVGPNGCGKSNLVEALRWAMGENSAKRMRGGDDYLFNTPSMLGFSKEEEREAALCGLADRVAVAFAPAVERRVRRHDGALEARDRLGDGRLRDAFARIGRREHRRIG